LNLFSTFDAGSEARVGFAMQKPRDLWPVFHRSSVSFDLQNRKRDRCKTLILQRSRMDSLIQKKEQYLAEIESYKKSLIFEYVTGKKEVI